MTLNLIRFFLLLSLFSLTANSAVVLQYHHIDNDTSTSTSTSVELFSQHLQYLINEKYEIISLPELITRIKNHSPLNDNVVAITFDDGYESVYNNAFPLLKTYKIPFTIFIDTAAIEEKRRNHVSWDQLREMKLSGATIGNHSHSHSHLIRYQEAVDGWTERVSDEINQAQEIINKRLNQDNKLLAYPYGEFDKNLLQLTSELGYVAFGQHSGAISEDSNLQHLPRFPASNRFGQFPQLITKLQSIAFKKLRFEPMHDVLTNGALNPPILRIRGDRISLQGVNCYGSAGELTKSSLGDGELSFKASKSVTTRRFRYNCTARQERGNRYMWISIPWINPAIKE